MSMETYAKSAKKRNASLTWVRWYFSDRDDSSSRVVCSKYSTQSGCRLSSESSSKENIKTISNQCLVQQMQMESSTRDYHLRVATVFLRTLCQVFDYPLRLMKMCPRSHRVQLAGPRSSSWESGVPHLPQPRVLMPCFSSCLKMGHRMVISWA